MGFKNTAINKLSAIVISSAENIYKFPNLNAKVLAIVKKEILLSRLLNVEKIGVRLTKKKLKDG